MYNTTLISFGSLSLSKSSKSSGSKNSSSNAQSRFAIGELLSTYIRDLRQLAFRFMKELHNGYNRDMLKDDVFSKSGDERYKIVYSKIEVVLNKVIQAIVGNKSNIYAALNYKYLMLNFE